MTLDEAIKHAEEVAVEQDKLCKRYDDASGYSRSHNESIRVADAKWCERCAKEHRQLAEWLKELKQLRKQTNWISVSERLPEENGFYLATCDGEICGENEPFTGLAEYENGKWVDDEEDYQCVLAWMPLPKPYKEREVEE